MTLCCLHQIKCATLHRLVLGLKKLLEWSLKTSRRFLSKLLRPQCLNVAAEHEKHGTRKHFCIFCCPVLWTCVNCSIRFLFSADRSGPQRGPSCCINPTDGRAGKSQPINSFRNTPVPHFCHLLLSDAQFEDPAASCWLSFALFW